MISRGRNISGVALSHQTNPADGKFVLVRYVRFSKPLRSEEWPSLHIEAQNILNVFHNSLTNIHNNREVLPDILIFKGSRLKS